MDLYIVRHGESEGNVRIEKEKSRENLSREDRDNPVLTELGKHQAELIGKRFESLKIDAIISSPLRRTAETANQILKFQKEKPVLEIMQELMEVGTPEGYIGTDFETLKAIYPQIRLKEIFTEERILPTDIEGSNPEQILKRAKCVMDYVHKRFSGDENVMLVAHGTFNHSLINAAIKADLLTSFNFCQENTGLTKIKYFDNGKIRLSFMDDLSHLIPEYPHLTFSL